MILRPIRKPKRPAHAVLDEVPVQIGVSRHGDYWYLTTVHGATFETHDHIEIRLDRVRLEELDHEVRQAMAELEEERGNS